MPLFERSTTLTASASPDGIYVYTKTKQGRITQARNTITSEKLAVAFQDKQDEVNQGILRHSVQWDTDVLNLICSPDSTLCGVAWDSYTQSIFYQDDQGTICEWRKLNDGDWVNFSTPLNGLRGTNIAVAHACNGNRIMLFYQGVDYHIYCAHAQLWQWGPQLKIAKATKSTGIGTTSRKDLSEVWLYFQDDNLSICEYSGSFTGPENFTKAVLPLKTEGPIEDITAISWQVGSETKIRLYLQDSANNIVDYSKDGANWSFGTLKAPCFPNADIIAVIRDIGLEHEFCINVFWVGEGQELYQRVCVGDTTDQHEAHKIMEVSDVGTFAGSLSGKKFSDLDGKADADALCVHAVNVRVFADGISAIGFEFKEVPGTEVHGGTADVIKQFETTMHGGTAGDIKRFELEEGEEITYMSIVTSEDSKRIQGLMFATSNGRDSDWYGCRNDSRSQSWAKSGHPLIGFSGAADDVVRGLRPLWATRVSSADVSKTPQLIADASTLNINVEKTSQELKQFLVAAARLKDEASHDFLGESTDKIATLACSIEYLNDLTHRTYLQINERRQSEGISLRKICGAEAEVVERTFQGAIQRIKECQGRVKKLFEDVEGTATTFEDHAKGLDPLLIKINAVRYIIKTEVDRLFESWQEEVRHVTRTQERKPSNQLLGGVIQTCNLAKNEYEQAKMNLDDIVRQIQELDSLRTRIEKQREPVQAEVRKVRGYVREASDSLAAFTRLSERFNTTYSNGKILTIDDRGSAQVLASDLLKLVTLIFEDPELEKQVGSGKIKPDQLRGALGSITSAGRLN